MEWEGKTNNNNLSSTYIYPVPGPSSRLSLSLLSLTILFQLFCSLAVSQLGGRARDPPPLAPSQALLLPADDCAFETKTRYTNANKNSDACLCLELIQSDTETEYNLLDANLIATDNNTRSGTELTVE